MGLAMLASCGLLNERDKTEQGDKAPCLTGKHGRRFFEESKVECKTPLALVCVDVVPHTRRIHNEQLRKIFHLPEPGPEIADFLTGVVDVENQGFVVGLELLRVLVLVLFNIGLDADHQVDLLVLSWHAYLVLRSSEQEDELRVHLQLELAAPAGEWCCSVAWETETSDLDASAPGVRHAGHRARM